MEGIRGAMRPPSVSAEPARNRELRKHLLAMVLDANAPLSMRDADAFLDKWEPRVAEAAQRAENGLREALTEWLRDQSKQAHEAADHPDGQPGDPGGYFDKGAAHMADGTLTWLADRAAVASAPPASRWPGATKENATALAKARTVLRDEAWDEMDDEERGYWIEDSQEVLVRLHEPEGEQA